MHKLLPDYYRMGNVSGTTLNLKITYIIRYVIDKQTNQVVISMKKENRKNKDK